jgi:uncharacterized protein YcnI
LIDPLGFALESFDAVGAWRIQENGRPVDSSAQLADGTPVNGVAELRNTLTAHPDAFTQTLTEKMMVYALGRGLQYYDMPVIRGIVREAATKNRSFSSIVLGIARSTPFQMRNSGPDPKN